MKVTILTEGGSSCGYGSVSRCKALYQAFIERSITPELIINGDETIAHLLDDVPYMLRDWISDWTAVCERVSDADISIVDSYLAAQEIYKNVSGWSRKAVYIDDTNRIDYPPGCWSMGASDGKNWIIRIAKELIIWWDPDIFFSERNSGMFLPS